MDKYKTYAWIPPSDSSLRGEAIMRMYGKLVKSASDGELKKKGLVQDEEHPDAVFRFRLGIKKQIQYSQSPTLSVGVGYGGLGYYAGAYVPVAGGNIRETRADEAYISFEMFDTKTGYLLWSGGARKTVDNSADSEKNTRLAIQSVFSRLPIRHKIK